jgi:uncharacterized protein YndB with AHSA1/START domain
MATQKDFKRLVRGRMQKTGESYTTARASLLTQGAKRKSSGNGVHAETNGHGTTVPVIATAPAAPKAQPADFAKLAGMADEVIKEKTGCTWDRWVWALDQVNAYNWPHREIAQYVREKYKVADWWTQAVTVGYERIKGLREIGQRRSGSWEASKSKTINAAASTVFKSFKQPKLRSAWLDARPALRTAVPNKTIRMTWEDGSSVEVYVVAKGRSKTQVAVQHTKLPNREAVDRMKWFWGDHLDRLAAKLERKR